MKFFSKETKTAFEAIEYAQFIAHAPMVFQASRVLRDSGILQAVFKTGDKGLSLEEIVSEVAVPSYGVRVLVEAGLGIGLLLVNDDKYTLSKAGYFILNDAMTRVNMDFSHDVCYEGMFYLDEAIETGNPSGLKVFGKWNTVYEALSQLPEKVRKSWLAFDHFYSDDAFPLVLPLVFKDKPKKLMDIGGNTGKWSIACGKYDADVKITIVDLPGQVNMAKENIEKEGLSGRISFYGTNVLSDKNSLPKGFDAIWMSQFLDCFSENEIIAILKKCKAAINKEGNIFILEPFWDRQRFSAAAFSLQQTSLYFTAIANGNSQMYDSRVFFKCIEASGLDVIEQTDNIGISQSLLKCKIK